MADKQIALIRGINVGSAKRVAMADLRALVEDLGYRDVRTLLNSGNIVFTVPGAARGNAAARIEKGLAVQLRVPARVTLLTAAELAVVVKANPLCKIAVNPSLHFVAFLTNPADRVRLKPLAEKDWAPEVLAIGTRVAYLWCPEGMLQGRLPEAVGRVLGDAVTMRNWATVMKLHTLAADRVSSAERSSG
jgi:uncharacterized protein (DUF1697 family)